jgi:replicative DNA helicase
MTTLDPSLVEAALATIDKAAAAGYVTVDESGMVSAPSEAETMARMDQERQDRREASGTSSDLAIQEKIVVGFCLVGDEDHREQWAGFRANLGLRYHSPLPGFDESGNPGPLWSDKAAAAVAWELDATFRNRRDVRVMNGKALIESFRSRVDAGIEPRSFQGFSRTVQELEALARDQIAGAATDYRIATQLLQSKWGRHRLEQVAKDLIRDGVRREVAVEEVTARALQGLEEARGILSGRMETAQVFAGVGELWGEVETQMYRERRPPISTSIDALDLDIGGGVQPNDAGRLCLIGARTGVGKTTLAVAAAGGLVRNGAHVLFLSCELNRREIGARFLSNYAHARRGELADWDLLPQWRLEGRGKVPGDGVGAAYGELLRLWQEDRDSGRVGGFHTRAQFLASAEDFAESIRTAKAQHPEISAVFLDHFHAMTPIKGGSPNRSQEMEVRAQLLHGVAKECEVDLFLLCQLNREAALAKAPGPEHINGTDALAQLASAVWLLENVKPEEGQRMNRDLMDLHHGKFRNGQFLNETRANVEVSHLRMVRDHCAVVGDTTSGGRVD